MNDLVEPFTVGFGADEVAALRRHLARTRWPDRETVDDWTQGVPLARLRELCAYWADRYDFAAAVERLNRHPQFRTTIEGLGIHFIHVRSRHPGALPLVLTHGWPGSVVEFLDVVEPLVNPDDPADAFHVVVPSLPGYGWSDRPAVTGWSIDHTAGVWDQLMARIGYRRYGAQGGDWGAFVTTTLARRFPERVAGIHLNLPTISFDGVDLSDVSEDEQAALASLEHHTRWGRGYGEIQTTRPQTLGYGLTDSPAGQCAWIYEKFWTWTDRVGGDGPPVATDTILDNVSVYWFTATAAASARMYWESRRTLDVAPVHVPTGISVFPKDISPLSRRWCERRYTDLRRYHRLPAGGHFASLEQPATFVDEVRGFFRTIP